MKIKSIYILIGGLLLFCGSSISVSGQDNPESENYENDRSDHWHHHIPHRHHRSNTTTLFFGFSLGINGYLNEGNINLPSELDDLELVYGNSWEFSWHVIKQRIDLYKDRFRLYYGPEFVFSRYRFVNDVTLVPGQSEVTITRDDIDYKKNRLRTVFLTLPVTLEYKAKHGRYGNSFRMAFGASGGILLGAKTRQKSEEFGVQKKKDDFNLNKFRLGLKGQIGFGHVGFFVDYGLTKFFKEDEGPSLNPITFGLVWFWFD